jgi:hypothetical protein
MLLAELQFAQSADGKVDEGEEKQLDQLERDIFGTEQQPQIIYILIYAYLRRLFL